MSQNMGKPDRLVRAVLVAPVLVIAALLIGPSGWLAILLYVLAAVMWATAGAGSCPAYSMLGLRTCPLQRVGSDESEHAGSR